VPFWTLCVLKSTMNLRSLMKSKFLFLSYVEIFRVENLGF
jgi:hypothetical protein